MGEKIVLGLSGGIDSAYAAILLKEQGFSVVAVYALMDDRCDGSKDAELLAERLGLEFVLLDERERFCNEVLRPFVDQYTLGRTPNPCVLCNPRVKIRSLIETADNIGAEKIATGHYAKPCKVGGRYSFAPAVDRGKDQGYFLYGLPQEFIARTVMPLAGVNKSDIRAFFTDGSIISLSKGESNDICFAADGYRPIIEQYGVLPPEGRFVDSSGKTLGSHSGIHNYTVGQRKGLGIALGKPAFVKSINAADNTVVLSFAEDAYCGGFDVSDVNYLAAEGVEIGESFSVRVRYRSKPVGCVITSVSDSGISVAFDAPERVVAPGQSAVFYNDDGIIAFGGVIR